MKKIIKLIVIILLTLSCLLANACDNKEDDNTNTQEAIDPMIIEVTENYINAFWDPEYKCFYRNSTHLFYFTAGPGFGLYSDFWWEAQNWETVMDIYERQGGEFYRDLIDKVYDGFIENYEHYSHNEYNDDIGWWAMGCTRAYSITRNRRYLDDAKEMFDYIYGNYTEELGGGIYWRADRQGKNVCTNAPAAITAARLSVLLDDESYLTKSRNLFNWIKTYLYDEETGKLNDTVNINGPIYEGQFSYNYGTFARAAHELYLVTGEESYLNYIEKPLDYFLSYKLENGIVSSEGIGDGAAFRSIFFRTLNVLAKTTRPDYQQIINQNAVATYNNRRDSDKLCGHDWTTVPAEEDIIVSIMVSASVSLMQYYEV